MNGTTIVYRDFTEIFGKTHILALTLIFPPISFIGFVLNLIMTFFIAFKEIGSKTSKSLFCLYSVFCSSNCLVIIFLVLIFHIENITLKIDNVTNKSKGATFSPFFLFFFAFSEFSIILSACLLCLLSIDRFCLILFPMSFVKFAKFVRFNFLTFFILSLTFGLISSIFARKYASSCANCFFNFSTPIFMLVCAIIQAITYSVIIVTLTKKTKSRSKIDFVRSISIQIRNPSRYPTCSQEVLTNDQATGEMRRYIRNVRVSRCLIVLFLASLLSFLPYSIQKLSKSDTILFLYMLAYSNSLWNPLIYTLSTQKFRLFLKHCIRCKCCSTANTSNDKF